MRFVRLPWITKGPGRAWVGSVPNKHNPSTKSGQDACISSRITMVIHVMNDHQINDNCFNEPFAVSPCRSLYWDMHGLIFETSIWLLAGSTRFVHKPPFRWIDQRKPILNHSRPDGCIQKPLKGSISTQRRKMLNSWTFTLTPESSRRKGKQMQANDFPFYPGCVCWHTRRSNFFPTGNNNHINEPETHDTRS